MAADEPVVKTETATPSAIKVVVLSLTGVILALFLWRARSLFLIVFLAVIAGLALSSATDWLERHRVRRSFGAPLVMLLLLGSLAGIVAMVAPTVRDQVKHVSSEVPKAMQKVEEWLGVAQQKALGQQPQQQQGQQQQGQQQQGQQQQGQQQQGQQPQGQQPQGQQQPQQGQEQLSPQQGGERGQGGRQGEQRGGLQSMIQGQARSAGRILFPMLSSTFEAIAGVLIVIFLSIYIAVSPRTYEKGILHLIPHSKRPRARELLAEVAETLRGWLVARLLAMIIIAAITGIGLAVLGIKAAIALAFIAGLLELIPFYGPIVAAVPAIGVALVESPQKAISVAVLYLIIQQIEGNVLTPLLLKQRLEVPPVLTIVAVSALGIVFGVVGMLAAEPLVAAGLVITRKLYVRDVIGDDVD